MITFTILVLALIGLVVLIAVCGAGFIVAFGDVLICAAIIYFIVKHLLRK